jgi:hypothetical protein
MFEAKLDESVFQFAEVVDRAIVHVPVFILVAPESDWVLKNSKSVMVRGPENALAV